jgi:hypothetical protein
MDTPIELSDDRRRGDDPYLRKIVALMHKLGTGTMPCNVCRRRATALSTRSGYLRPLCAACAAVRGR